MSLQRLSSLFSRNKMEAAARDEYYGYVCSKILDNLYLGSLEAAHSMDLMGKLGIKCILSVYDGNLRVIHSGIKYRKIQVSDRMTSDLLSEFDRAHRILKEYLDRNEPVLVHCRMGISRSATVVVAYLMKEQGMGTDQAMGLVRKKRSIAPNPAFQRQLEIYQEMGCSLVKSNGEFKRPYRCYYNQMHGRWLSAAVSLETNKALSKISTRDNVNLFGTPILKCYFCRNELDAQLNDVEAHHSPDCALHVTPKEWMYEGQLQGKILCGTCNVKLGSFDWAGKRCGCGTFATPWFTLIPSKIDLCYLK